MRYLLVALVLSLSTPVRADEPVLEPIARGERPPRQRAVPNGANRDARLATIVAGVVGVATLATALKFNSELDREIDGTWRLDTTGKEHFENVDSVETWRKRTIGMVGLTIISAGVAGYFWSRTQPTFDVSPMRGGASVSFSAKF